MGLNQEPRTTDPLHKYAHSIQHMSCMGRIVITMITKYVIYEPCMSCSMSHDEALDVHGSGQSCQRHLACVLSSLPRTARGQACHLFGATSVNTLRVMRTLQYEPQICVRTTWYSATLRPQQPTYSLAGPEQHISKCQVKRQTPNFLINNIVKVQWRSQYRPCTYVNLRFIDFPFNIVRQ